jgi:hypothetical protein
VIRRARGLPVLLAAAAALLLAAPEAFACPVCYGDTESPMAAGMRAGILFMVLITYLTIGGMAAFYLAVRRKARRAVPPPPEVS